MIDDIKKAKMEAKKEQYLRELARRHLIDFTQYFKNDYEANWHHNLIGEYLEAVERREINRLMIFMPPRHGKSELASVHFPAWYLGKHPNHEIIATSYSAELSAEFGRKVRMIADTKSFTNIFPEATLDTSTRAADNWHLKAGGAYMCTGVGGSITGRGANILLIDDPIKGRKEANSPLIRNITWEWYRGTAYSRLMSRGAIVLINTRWHDMDLSGMILNSRAASYWTVLELPAIAIKDEVIKGKFIRKKGGALWPDRYPIKVLEDIKRNIGNYEWACLYQQNPVNEETMEFYKENFKYRTEVEVSKLLTRRFLTVDTKGKLNPDPRVQSNYIGFCDNRVDREGMWNFRAWKSNMNPGDLVDYLFALQQKYRFEKIGIEKTMLLDGLEPYIEKKIIETQSKEGFVFPYVPLKHKGNSKELRIRGLLPYYRNGKIFHIEGECDELESQLLRFPSTADDDIMDAAAYQLQIAESPLGWKDDDFEATVDKYGDPIRQSSREMAQAGGFNPHNPLGEI